MEQTGGAPLDRVCAALVALTGVDGAQVSVMAPEVGRAMASVGAAGTVSIQELEFDLGEGPSIDAHRDGVPVLVADLSSTSMWPMFAPAAARNGVAAVFAFPVATGAARVGVLALCSRATGPFDTDQQADGVGMADIVLDLMLAAQDGDGLDVIDQSTVAASNWQTHQATGMVAVQLAVGMSEALVRLRSHAFAVGQPLTEVAAAVVAHRLHLTL